METETVPVFIKGLFPAFGKTIIELLCRIS
jgi:hypothetical protein